MNNKSKNMLKGNNKTELLPKVTFCLTANKMDEVCTKRAIPINA